MIQIQECGFHPGCGTMEQLFILAFSSSLHSSLGLLCPLITGARAAFTFSAMKSSMFLVSGGLHQDYALSPILFMDRLDPVVQPNLNLILIVCMGIN